MKLFTRTKRRVGLFCNICGIARIGRPTNHVWKVTENIVLCEECFGAHDRRVRLARLQL